MKKTKQNNGLEMTGEGAPVYGIVRKSLSEEVTSWLRCEQEASACGSLEGENSKCEVPEPI